MIKTVALSLLMVSSCAHSMEPEIVQLSAILHDYPEQIKTFTARQNITVTEKDNEALAKLFALNKKRSSDIKLLDTFVLNTNNKEGSIEPAVYNLVDNSYLNKDYMIHIPGSHCSTQNIAHHLKLSKSSPPINGSLFKSNLVELIYYDLNIIYMCASNPSNCFDLNKKKHSYIIDNGIEKQAERINNYFKINTKIASIANLLILQRY